MPFVPPVAPTREAAHGNGERAGQAVLAAVPAGLTGTLEHYGSDGAAAATWQVESRPEYLSTVNVRVTDGAGYGTIGATVHGGLTGVGTDPCGAAVVKILLLDSCTVTTVHGIPVGAGSARVQGEIPVNFAVRVLDGGLVYAHAYQAVLGGSADDLPPDARPDASRGGSLPGLAAPPLSTTALSELVTHPELLP